MPSMEMMPLPSSSLEARNTLAAVFLFPTISMKSPMSTLSSFLVLVSMRARPSPTSD